LLLHGFLPLREQSGKLPAEVKDLIAGKVPTV
jgi:hypothetical protein